MSFLRLQASSLWSERRVCRTWCGLDNIRLCVYSSLDSIRSDSDRVGVSAAQSPVRMPRLTGVFMIMSMIFNNTTEIVTS